MTALQKSNDAPCPWYRVSWMWLIVGLPASAVVAGFLTLWLAMRYPDAEVSSTSIHEPVNEVLGRNSVAPPKH